MRPGRLLAGLAAGAMLTPGKRIPSGQLWAGSPAQREGKTHAWWPEQRPTRARGWQAAFGLSSTATTMGTTAGYDAWLSLTYVGK